MDELYNILVIGNDEDDFVLIKKQLDTVLYDSFQITQAKTIHQAIQLYQKGNFDVVFLDITLNNYSITENLNQIIASLPDAVVIVLADTNEFNETCEIINSGAQDHLIKGTYTAKSLFRSIMYAISRHKDLELMRKQNQLSITLASTVSLDQAIEAILDFGLSLDEFTAGAIYYYDNEKNEFQISCHKGITEKFAKEVRIIHTSTMLGSLMNQGSNQFFQNIQNSSGEYATGIDEGFKYLALLPLKHNNQIIACLNLASKTQTSVSNKIKTSLESTLAQISIVIHHIQTEEKLEESKRNYQDLVEKTDVAISIDDSEGRVIYYNDAFLKLFGYKAADKHLLNHATLIHPDDYPFITSNHKDRLNRKKVSNRYESRGVKKDGTVIYLEFILSNIIEKDGKIIGSRTYIIDISKRKKNEEALASSESFNRRLMENSPIGLLHINALGVITYENKTLRELNGIKAGMDSPIIGKNFTELNSIKKSGLDELLDKIKKGNPVHAQKIKFKAHNGIDLILSVDATTLVNDKNQYDGAILMLNDITEKQKAEESLKISEEKYRTLFEKSTDPILIIKNNHFVQYNKAAIDLLKFTDSTVLEGIHPSKVSPKYQPDGRLSKEKANEMMQIAKQNGFHRFEWLHNDMEGNEIWIDVSLTLIPSDNEPVIYTIWRNINDRKLAEDALKENEEKYRIIFENSPVGIVITDIDGNFLVYNDQIVEMSKYTREEFSKHNVIDLYKDPKQREQLLKNIDKTGSVKNVEIDFLTKGGETFIANMSSSNYMVGEKPAILTVIFDITERKRNQLTREIIHNISSAVTTTENINELYEVIQKELSKIIGTKNFTIGFYNKEKNDLYFPYMQDEIRNIKNIPLENTISSIVFSTNKSLLLNSSQIETLYEEGKVFKHGGIAKSWLGVPFGSKNTTEGILIVQDYKIDNAFSREDLNLMEIIANQIAASIKQKQYQEQIRKLSRSLEQSPASVIITNLNGEIEYVNKKFTEVSGYSSEEAKGKDPKFIGSGKTSSAVYKQMWTNLLSGKEWKGVFINQRKNGEIYHEEAWIAPLEDKSGKATHYLAVKEDISDRIIADNELIQAKERAEESDRIKTAFLATMSHELRTPLNAVIGFSELIPESADIEEISEFSDLINKSGHHLLSIIEDIFDISVLEAGKIETTSTEIVLDEFISDIEFTALKELKNQFKSHLELIVHNSESSTNLRFFCDQQKLQKVFTHLIKNAVKFTSEGSIELGCKQVNDNLRFYVKDSGIGIPLDKQQIIFEAFRQVDDSHTREYGGTGVGLAISKKMLDLLGGEINVESEIGKGSCFYFTIPCSNFIKTTDQMKTSIDQYPDLKGKTILIAEDEQTNYMYLEVLLKRTHATILWAENGSIAADLFNKNDIDIILMDLKMPIMNGYDAAQIIKEKSAETIIIAQTAFALPGDKQKAIAIGFDDYITKPISNHTLMKSLSKFSQ
ncbi:MAG: PAS domain S-box protein [Bacteroidales bacterium]|nr:PAS domain S-box protein [Bacteroidales bacterium]